MLVYNYIILDLSPIFSFYTILQPPWVVCIIVWLAFWYMISTPCFPSKLTASYLWHCEKHCLRCLHNPYLRSPNLEDILGVNPSLGFTMMHRVPPDDSQRKVQRQESCFFFYCWSPQFYGRYDAGTRQPLSDEFWFGSHWWSDDSRLIGLDVFTYIALIWKLSIPKERLQHSICCC